MSSEARFDRRHGHVGDAEHDPFAGSRTRDLSNAVLSGAKCRRNDACGYAGRRGIAPEGGSGLDFQTCICRLVREVAALVEFLNNLGRLGAQAGL